MTDGQIIAICISIVFPLSMLLYSNSRIADAKETLKTEIGEAKQTLRFEISEIRVDMFKGLASLEKAITRLETALKVHELEHHK